MSKAIDTEEEWEAQPVGTLARVGFIEHDDNGNEVDEGKTMTILRVEGDITVTVGNYMLAGGRYWSEVWVWEQGAAVIDTATVLSEPLHGPITVSANPMEAGVQVLEVASLERAQPAAVLGRLIDLGWTPPNACLEGVQVSSISGSADGN